jgi:transposase
VPRSSRDKLWNGTHSDRATIDTDIPRTDGFGQASASSLPLNLGGARSTSSSNLSTHKTKRVREFLAEHPNVHLHFTPTYSSWLNQVENWFARIERDVIARGVFTSVRDLARKLMRYIRHHNRAAKPIKWAYRDPSHRILPTFDSAVTGH